MQAERSGPRPAGHGERPAPTRVVEEDGQHRVHLGRDPVARRAAVRHTGDDEAADAAAWRGAFSKTHRTARAHHHSAAAAEHGRRGGMGPRGDRQGWHRRALSKIIKEEGVRALWKGNMVTVIQRLPYSSINFYLYENIMDFLEGEGAFGRGRNDGETDKGGGRKRR